MKYLRMVALLPLFLLAACSSTLKTKPLDARTGYFPTQTKLDAEGIKTQKPFSDTYKNLVYIKIDDSKSKQYTAFFVESFKNMKSFGKVDEKADLESIVITQHLSDKVATVSDLVGLNKLQASIGPFLIVEPYVEWKGGYSFMAQLKATDPSTGETVLLLEQTAFNWAGLDEPLFYPLLNAFMQWTRGERIATAGVTVAPTKPPTASP